MVTWRDLNNWSLNHRPAGVEEAIGEVFARTFQWKRVARGTAGVEVWRGALADAGAGPAWRLLADRQAQTVRNHYGTDPDWALVLASYAGFGAGTFPPDPLRTEDPIHQMDGARMWVQWADGFCLVLFPREAPRTVSISLIQAPSIYEP
jgi:hypothetical protein